jgi:tRNA(Ile)-lysidine synthetase-like protein
LQLRVGAWQTWGPHWRFRLKLAAPTARKLQQDKAFYFDPRLLDAGLRVRTAKAGERMKPFGASPGSKLLRDLLAEAGVPSWQRAGWPVLEAGSQVLGLPGVRRGQAFRVLTGSKALCLQWEHSPAALAGQA